MSGRSDPSLVKRRTVTLSSEGTVSSRPGSSSIRIIRPRIRSSPQCPQIPTHTLQAARQDGTPRSGCTVLVLNASHPMAHEISAEISSTLPASTVLFAPTLSLALYLLKRRSIDLILSSDQLPDGPLSKLHEFLELMSPPPELVVLSDLNHSRSQMDSHPGYRFVEVRRLAGSPGQTPPPTLGTPSPLPQPGLPALTSTISALGADLRNDLNNPLQEIVAMAFVAHTSEGLSPTAEHALSAIQRAASNMEQVVRGLEDKIRGAVSQSAA